MTPAAVDLFPIAPALGPYLLAAGGVLVGAGALLRHDGAAPALARAWRRWREHAGRLQRTRRATPETTSSAAAPAETPTAVHGAPVPAPRAPLVPERAAPPAHAEASAPSESPFDYDHVQSIEPDREPPPRFLSDDALTRFADIVHRTSEHAAAVAHAEEELAHLDRSVWHLARDFGSTPHGVVIPFVLLGPTGLFAIDAATGYSITDAGEWGRLCKRVREWMVPDYPDRLHAVVFLPFVESRPRSWLDGRGDGAWVVGRGQLRALLEQFDDDGASQTDLAALRAHLRRRPPGDPGLYVPERPPSG
jgi:hypothetical protein